MNSRQQLILQMVIDQGRVSVVDLAKTTGVSEVTIRQDLNLLEKQSYLRRAHGYAVPLDSDDVETRMMNNYALKRELAEFAASLVNPGETVFIENGSSNALLARTLAEQKDGWQPETGFTGRDMMRTDVVNAVLEKECEAIVLTDSSKFGAVHPYTMGPVSRFSRVITDERLSDEHRNKLEEDGLIVDIIKTSA